VHGDLGLASRLTVIGHSHLCKSFALSRDQGVHEVGVRVVRAAPRLEVHRQRRLVGQPRDYDPRAASRSTTPRRAPSSSSGRTTTSRARPRRSSTPSSNPTSDTAVHRGLIGLRILGGQMMGRVLGCSGGGTCVAVVGLLTLVLPARDGRGAPAARASSTCIATIRCDTQRTTSGGTLGARGLGSRGAVRRHRPEIEEDPATRPGLVALPEPHAFGRDPRRRGQGPRRPVPRRRAADIKQGDILVRARGAGSCGKMAILGGQVNGQWMTLEAGQDDSAMFTGNPLFFQRRRRQAARRRVGVSHPGQEGRDPGHVRELRRDLEHLERTVAERPVAARQERARRRRREGARSHRRGLVAGRRQSVRRRPPRLTGRRWRWARRSTGRAPRRWRGGARRRAPARAHAARGADGARFAAPAAGQTDKAVTRPRRRCWRPARRARPLRAGRSLIAAGKTTPAWGRSRFTSTTTARSRARRLMGSNGASQAGAPPTAARTATSLRLGGGPEHSRRQRVVRISTSSGR